MSAWSRRSTLALAVLLLSAAPASAQWSMIDDHELLEGMTIVDVGTIQSRTKEQLPPLNANRSVLAPLTQSTRYLEFRGKRVLCLRESLDVADYEVAAFLVRDKDGPVKLALIRSSIGSTEVKLRPLELIACP